MVYCCTPTHTFVGASGVKFLAAGEKRDIAPVARRAIKGLAALMTDDCCLQYQSEADSVRVRIPEMKSMMVLHSIPLLMLTALQDPPMHGYFSSSYH